MPSSQRGKFVISVTTAFVSRRSMQEGARNLHWRHNGQALEAIDESRTSDYYDDGRYRYRIIGSKSRGEYNLEIKDFSSADEGLYECDYRGQGYDGFPVAESKSANVTLSRKC